MTFERMTTPVRLPDLVLPLELSNLMSYGASTWDWHRVHYDDQYARSIGLEGPIVDGQMFGALIARQLREWGGPAARFTELGYRNRRFVGAPCVVTVVSHHVENRELDHARLIVVESVITDQSDRVIVDSGRTVLEVPKSLS